MNEYLIHNSLPNPFYKSTPVTPYPVVIGTSALSYPASGNDMEDKNTIAQRREDQVLRVENVYSSGRTTIQNLVLELLSEKVREKNTLDGVMSQRYNKHSKQAVVTSNEKEAEKE